MEARVVAEGVGKSVRFKKNYSGSSLIYGQIQPLDCMVRLAELMGHSNVYTTLNVYTQVMDGSLRAAVNKVGEELFSIVQFGEGGSELTH